MQSVAMVIGAESGAATGPIHAGPGAGRPQTGEGREQGQRGTRLRPVDSSHQLPQGRKSLLLGPLHRHGADLHPLSRSPQGQADEEREAKSRGQSS